MRSAAERIGRLVRLTPRERLVLLRAWWQLLLVGAALRLVPVTRLLPRAAPARPRTPSLPPERMAWLLRVARRHVPVRATCLTEALVYARLLRNEGLDATVGIGVARQDGRLCAHAWVEHRGRVVFGSPEPGTYAPLTPASAFSDGR